MTAVSLDAVDRRIVNALQGGFPLSATPFREAGRDLGLGEAELIERIDRLLRAGVLSRFGPMYNAERLGGAFVLCAMAVPEARFDEVAELVNAYPEVAHNYAREHALNMWFVLASDDAARIDGVIADIGARTGLAVHDFPKLDEYFIGLRVET